MSDDLYIGPSTLAPGVRQSSGERIARFIILPLVALLTLIILVFFFFFQAVGIDGPSMLPTLRSADRVLITRGATSLHRGDVVVLVADEGGTKTELVKRVVGVAGDMVEIRNDVAIVNGVREPDYGQQLDAPRYADSFPAVRVPDGHLYIMGDNRPLSEDSRYIGTVPVSGVMGRVVAVFAPIQRLRFVH